MKSSATSKKVEARGREQDLPEEPWRMSWEDLASELEVSPESGLSPSRVKKRRRVFGPNRIRRAERKSTWVILADQLKNLIVLLLAVAAALSLLLGHGWEGISIIVAIAINILIGFFTELKAVRSIEALQEMSRVSARVLRDGKIKEVASEEIVPGDLLIMERGDIVAADGRLFETERLEADESPLTGESMPVAKTVAPLEKAVPLAERSNMIFKGTSLTRGAGRGIVVATGMRTELGQISELAEEAEEEVTPLEKRLDRLGGRLVWLTLAIAALLICGGLVAGRDLYLMLETSIALAVAAVPEGLPVVATVALAQGVWRMARRSALMNHLSAVETLGSIDVICTDKTGTLTENRMTVKEYAIPADNGSDVEEVVVEWTEQGEVDLAVGERRIDLAERPILKEGLQVGVLCNNAVIKPENEQDEAEFSGDPLERALLALARECGITRSDLLDSQPEAREEAFDTETKMMATYHETDGRLTVAAKGAPESILKHCSRVRSSRGTDSHLNADTRDTWLRQNEKMAKKGLRVLAFAARETDSIQDSPYEDLTFICLVGLLDPPRSHVEKSVQALHRAGIRVVMVTGDQGETARTIAAAINLSEKKEAEVLDGTVLANPQELSDEAHEKVLTASIFSRVSPKQKLDLVHLFQQSGSVVAMTGDGVNDAPALKKANVGIAMGRRGTQVAREAADVVLRDDAFHTIVEAVQQGRVIFKNIRRFILYLLSGNVGEIMIVAFALIVGSILPLRPLQILYLNMIGDVFPALALGVGRGDPSVMNNPPRDSKEAILTTRHWTEIGIYGMVIAGAVLTAFYVALAWLDMNPGEAVTVSFLTLSFGRLWHVFNMRDWGSGLVLNDITKNAFVWGALALRTGLLLLAVYVPALAAIIGVERPGIDGWLLIMAASVTPFVLVQTLKSSPVSSRLGLAVTARRSARSDS